MLYTIPKFKLISACVVIYLCALLSVRLCLYVWCILTQISIQFKISKKICLHSPFPYLTQVHRFYTKLTMTLSETRYFQNISSLHLHHTLSSYPVSSNIILGYTHWVISVTYIHININIVYDGTD